MTRRIIDLAELSRHSDEEAKAMLTDMVDSGIAQVAFPPDYEKYPYAYKFALDQLLLLSGNRSFDIVSDRYLFERARSIVTPKYLEGDPETGYHFRTPQRDCCYS